MFVFKLLINGVLISLTVLMAFYAAYKDSADFEDLADNGIWRAIYCWTSRVGYLWYKVDRAAYRFVMGRLKYSFDRKGRAFRAASIITSVVVSYLCLRGILAVYDIVLRIMFSGDEAVSISKNVLDHTIYRMINSVMALTSIVSHLAETVSITEFIVALGVTVVKIAVFVWFHILFFAVLYGYLKHKVKVLDLSARWAAWKKDVEIDGKDSKQDFIELMKNWWYDTTSENPILIVMAYKQNIAVILVTAIICGPALGDIVGGSWTDLLATALDAVDLINIVVSFAVNWALAKIVAKCGKKVGAYLPEAVQEKLHNLSVKLNAEVDKEYEEREDWVEDHDDEFFSVQCEKDYSLLDVEMPVPPTPPRECIPDFEVRMYPTYEEREEQLERYRAHVAAYGYDTAGLSYVEVGDIIRGDRDRLAQEKKEYEEKLDEYRAAMNRYKAKMSRVVYRREGC